MRLLLSTIATAAALMLGGMFLATQDADAEMWGTATAPDSYNMDPGSGGWYWFRRDWIPCGAPWAPYSQVIYQAYADPLQWYFITQRCDY